MTEPIWTINHRPEPQYAGYPWHIPATDPTQYHLLLSHDDLPEVAVLMPSREVWLWHQSTEDYHLLGHMGLDKEDWQFHPREYVAHFLSSEQVNILITLCREWGEEWDELETPNFGILRPPLEY